MLAFFPTYAPTLPPTVLDTPSAPLGAWLLLLIGLLLIGAGASIMVYRSYGRKILKSRLGEPAKLLRSAAQEHHDNLKAE